MPKIDYGAFDKNNKCIEWAECEITRHELEEAYELCYGNWIEIQHQCDYISHIQVILEQHGIDIPPEY